MKNGANDAGEHPADIETRSGDLLQALDLDAIVNPVNCRGVMGRGLARQFAKRYPEIVRPYELACADGSLNTRQPHIIRLKGRGSRPVWVVNLATKQHWRDGSRLGWIESGLEDMYRRLDALGAQSVGVPPLGAGLGGLPWPEVEAVLREQASRIPGIRTVIYAPARPA